MQKDRFKAISYTIIFTILVTIAIQGYWNFKNYTINKQHLVNDIQAALDGAVESYYADLAKTNMVRLTNISDSLNMDVKRDSTHWISKQDTLMISYMKKGSIPQNETHDFRIVLSDSADHRKIIANQKISKVQTGHLINLHTDTITRNFRDLAARIVISLESDSLDMATLNKFVEDELKRKNLDVEFTLACRSPVDQIVTGNESAAQTLTAVATTAYLPPGTNLELRYGNNTMEILKRGLAGLLISLLVTGVIIGVLIYLYGIIKDQKQLMEVKNDLINNITHEFKTPITTVVSALEGIRNFNQQGDVGKTKKYLDVSEMQLSKLDKMVEKLLETASLDQDKIELQKEKVNVSEVVGSLVEKYSVLNSGKSFKSNLKNDVSVNADPFHFENAISNLLDNAVKYGGANIEVDIEENNSKIELTVTDDGGKIPRSQKEKVFDKFYRIPTGNRHDTKGHGIGLYYARKIVEKHGGQLSLHCGSKKTEFKVVI